MAANKSSGWVVIPLGLFLSLIFVAASQAALADKVFETVLPNGLKVILLENHKVPEVSFQVWYRVGSRNEDWGKTGLSHMLEHMMFKGTQRVSGEAFSRLIEENGGNENAFTSKDFTAYYENISVDRIQVPIDLESDRMHNLVLREEDFRTERMVVMEERRMRTEDSPQSYLNEQVEATAFQTSPYRWPTIGWYEDIECFALEDLKSYYRIYYNPANAFLVVAGDLQKEEILPRIEKAFGPIPKGPLPDQKKGIDPPQSGERKIYVTREAQLPFIVMGYHVPNIQNPDGYVLEVIAAILTGGKSSRLYQNLVREKQLALSVDADNPFLSKDPNLFSFSAQPLPGQEVSELEKALNLEIERLQKEFVGNRELEKAKNQLEAGFVYQQDSLFAQAMLLAQHEITAGWRMIDDYIPSIKKVTAEDIRRVADKYFHPRNRTVGILVPLPPKEGQAEKIAPSGREHIIR